MGETVAAVVVTFNRKRLLIECLDALANQSRQLERIIVVDNASSDGTADLLRERGFLDRPLIDYVRLPTNTGGAGGFHEGIRRAFEAGYDWMWVMDDDAEPMPDALERLASAFALPGVAGVASLVVDDRGTPAWPFWGLGDVCTTAGKPTHGFTSDALSDEFADIGVASFVGFAVSRATVSAVGLPKSDLFIHHDDTEYSLRVGGHGRIFLATRSRILHKVARKAGSEYADLFGRRWRRIPWDELWLDYFGIRNLVWLRRRRCPLRIGVAFAIKAGMWRLIGVFLYEDHKIGRARFYMSAILDGWNGVFDNEKPRAMTGVK